MAFGKSQVNNTQPIVTISDEQNEEEIDRFEEGTICFKHLYNLCASIV